MYDIYAKLRDERGLTDYSVAKETGIATATMSAWKLGKYTPKIEKLMRIAKLFNVTVTDLLEDPDAVQKTR